MSSLMKLINSFRNATPSLQTTMSNSVYVDEGVRSKTAAEGRVRVELIQALNGRVLEVNTRLPNQDWYCELYLVRDDESVADAIATVLVLKGGA